MKKLSKFLPALIVVLALAFLVFHLDKTQRFLFFYREQQALFVYDWVTIGERYLTFGGLSLFLAHFLTQFFSVPLVGPIVTALLVVTSAWLLWRVLRRFTEVVFLLPLCLLPMLFEVENIFDFNYGYNGFVAMFLLSVAFWLYATCCTKLKPLRRVIVSSLMSVVFYLLAGPVGILFAVIVLLYDLLTRADKAYLQVIPIALVVLTGYVFIFMANVQSERFAFMIDGYYDPIMDPDFSFMYPWIAMVALLVLAFLLKWLPKLSFKYDFAAVVACCALTVWLFINSANKSLRDVFYPVIELQHYIVNDEWDKILNSRYVGLNNYLINNYVNLALSHEGKLLDHLFDIYQLGVNSLMLQGEKAELGLEIITTTPHMLYQMGNVAMAQNKAFDTMVASLYGNPSITKVLVKTNIIYGTYPIAEKYIRLLEHTWGYSDWVKKYRDMLYNEDAINADPELGLKRKDLPGKDTYPFSRGVYLDLLNVLDTGTADPAPRDYAIAFLLLAKDTQNMKKFVEKYYGTPVMKETPVLLQEALLESYGFDLDYCRKYGVNEETIKRYKDFNSSLLAAEMGSVDPETILKEEYGKTYWFYFVFN